MTASASGHGRSSLQIDSLVSDVWAAYSAAVSTHNARDQVTRVRQYQGPDTSNTYQDTITTYDGYGRRKTSHAPEQQVDPNNSSSTDHTTWEYKLDDTVEKITDARGASQIFSYNARHLVTGVTYTAPSGITPAAPVTHAYDAAGNRISMTDGMGSMSYNYDQLSRLTSETRTITGVGTYPLSYDYNLADELTSITNSFGAQVSYNYDLAGAFLRSCFHFDSNSVGTTRGGLFDVVVLSILRLRNQGVTQNGKQFEGTIEAKQRNSAKDGPLKFTITLHPKDLR